MTEQESKKEFRGGYYEERRERERRKAEKQEQTKTSTSQPPVKSELSKSTESKSQVQEISKRVGKSITIPTINLEKPAISFKTTSLTLDYPREKKERQLIVPKFKIIAPAFEFRSSKLDTGFSTKKETRTLVIPRIKLLKPVIEFSEDMLDVNYSLSKQGREIFVPKFATQKFSMPFETASLNADILAPYPSRQLTHQHVTQAQSESYEEKEELMKPSQPQESAIQALPISESQAESKEEASGEELQDPLEFLFGEGAGKVRDVEPLLILFKDVPNDSYIQTFEMFLLRSYREKHGGYPEVKKLSLRDDWNKREIEQWLDEGKLFLIDLDTEDVKINKELLADRLWAIFSKRRGVVVFYTKDDKIFERYKALLNEINWNKLQLGAKIVKITPRKLSFEEKLKLAGLVFGFVDIGEVPASMDAILNASRDKYEAKLKKLEEEYYHILGIVKPGENESVEHLRGKAFIVHWLIKQFEEKEGEKKDWKFIKDHVKTEEPKNGVIVDVCFNDENYEFETLFEEGFGKIHKTLRKYEQFQANVEIVVEPITAFLHAKEFAKLIRLVKQVYPTLNVGFYTLDLKNERLMPLEDYLKELKDFSSVKRGKSKMVKA